MRDTGIVHTVTFTKGKQPEPKPSVVRPSEKMDTDVRKISVDIK